DNRVRAGARRSGRQDWALAVFWEPHGADRNSARPWLHRFQRVAEHASPPELVLHRGDAPPAAIRHGSYPLSAMADRACDRVWLRPGEKPGSLTRSLHRRRPKLIAPNSRTQNKIPASSTARVCVLLLPPGPKT